MSENAKPPASSARELQDQAIEWVVDKHVTETWNENDQIRLDEWMNASPAHLVAYWSAEDSWNRTELLGALRSVRPVRAQDRQRTWVRWTRHAAMAAAVVVVGAVATAYLSSSAEQRYVTPVGGRETLSLADGSKIELNTDTALRIEGNGAQRTATLEKGEAFFQIKHNSKHPFVVRAASHRIVDLGTKFSVRADGDRVRVALVEGSARIDGLDTDRRAGSTLLEPGDVAIATSRSISVSRKKIPELTSELSWRRGILIFDGATLAEVAAEFNRYNDKKIVVADPQSARLTVAGAFQANDLQAVTNIAREVFKLRVAQKNNEILIARSR